MRELGPNQKGVLDALQRHGKYEQNGRWVWDNHSGTVKILESLVKRGLVVKSRMISELTGDPYDRYELAPAEEEHGA